MNKQELKEEVRKALGGTATPMAAELALDAVLRSIQEGLSEDGEVKLSGFGCFSIQELRARRIHQPHKGELYEIPNRLKVQFKASPQQQITLS